ELFTKISDRCFTKKNKTITNLITILIKLKKIKLLNEISQLINSHIIKINGFTETIVVFASNPSVKQLKMVEEILEGEFSIKPKINLKIDKDVLAGFHAFFDGKMLDASLYKSFANLATARIQ
ncbi:MAG: hypothetical protein EB127_10630, partial [Alphaproteobacteria bacterium]|nr:hypothetical protein [Alphaproteobacteria bacterium]